MSYPKTEYTTLDFVILVALVLFILAGVTLYYYPGLLAGVGWGGNATVVCHTTTRGGQTFYWGGSNC